MAKKRARARGRRTNPLRLRDCVYGFVETFNPRDIEHHENLANAAAWIAEEFRRAGGRVSGQRFSVRGHAYYNAIGSFGPEGKEVVVVGAHYDAASGTPGADDNASGVAGLVELAGILARCELKRRVDLVAYSLEEEPFATGSAVHAQSLVESKADVMGMMSLEMIGYFSDEPGSQKLPSGIEGVGDVGNFITIIGDQEDFLERVDKKMRRGTILPVLSSSLRFDLSDHVPYREAGFPAVMITDTAMYRNPNYHQPTDTPETLNYENMAEVLMGVFEVLLDLTAEGKELTTGENSLHEAPEITSANADKT